MPVLDGRRETCGLKTNSSDMLSSDLTFHPLVPGPVHLCAISNSQRVYSHAIRHATRDATTNAKMA